MSGSIVISAQVDAFQGTLVGDNYVPDGAYAPDYSSNHELSSDAITVRLPPGTRVGDVLLAFAAKFPSSANEPTGVTISGSNWTALDSGVLSPNGDNIAYALWYKVVTSLSEDPISFNSTGTTFSGRIIGTLVRVCNADTADPIGSAHGDETYWLGSSATSPLTVVLPSLTAVDNSVYVGFAVAFIDANYTFTDDDILPAGFTRLFQSTYSARSGDVNGVRDILVRNELVAGTVAPSDDIAWTGSGLTWGAGYITAGAIVSPVAAGGGFTVTPLFYWDLF